MTKPDIDRKTQIIIAATAVILFFAMLIFAPDNKEQELSEEANFAFDEGKFAKAVELYDEIIESNPRNPVLYHNRASAHLNLENYSGAISDYSAAIALKPDYAEAYNGRGLAYYKLKDNLNSRWDCTKAIQLKKNYAEAYHNRGLAKCLAMYYDEAINDFDSAIIINPKLRDRNF